MNYRLRIAGQAVANPIEGGIKIVDEPIWADGAGRNVTTGEMIATLVCWKRQVEITWASLTFAQAKTIIDAIKNGGAFFYIQFNDYDQTDHSGTVYKAIRVYTSNIPRTLLTMSSPSNEAMKRFKDITIIFTEK